MERRGPIPPTPPTPFDPSQQMVEYQKELIALLKALTPPKPSYEIHKEKLDTATIDKPVDIAGDYLAIFTNGLLEEISVKLDEVTNDSWELSRFNHLRFPFKRFYLTWTAQAGKTLSCFVGQNASATTMGSPRWAVDETKPAVEPSSTILMPQIQPAAKATFFNTAVGAAANILAAGVTPTNSPSIFRVTIALDAAQTFNAQLTRAGVAVALLFNAGVALVANSVYTFDLPVRSSDTVNFQLGGAATVLVLNVDEIAAAGP